MTACNEILVQLAEKDRRIIQLEFLYGDAIAKLAASNTKTKTKTKNKDKNIECAICGGVTSSIPSIAKNHEQTQKHQRMLCQFIEDDKEEDEGSESVISASGSDVSVFDDDESVLAPNGDSIKVKRYTFSELPASVYSFDEEEEEKEEEEEEEEDVFQDASAKAPTTYNKARYESACRQCLCGGKTSSIKSFAKRHEATKYHQKYLAHCDLSSIE
jgi:hypothetical protein